MIIQNVPTFLQFLKTSSRNTGNGWNYAVTWHSKEPFIQVLSNSDIKPWTIVNSWQSNDWRKALVVQDGLLCLSNSRIKELHGYSNISSGRCRLLLADPCDELVVKTAQMINDDRFIFLRVC